MKRIMNLYESCKMPIRIAFFGFLLIGFGFLIQNENVNIFYTFRNSFLLLFAEGCLLLGKAIITNLPLIFMVYLVCKKANSGVPIALALIGYFSFLIATSLFAPQNLSTYAYATNVGINSMIDLSVNGRYPLETGMIGSFIVAFITRFSYIRSRHRTSRSILGFLNKDSAAIIYNIAFTTLAGIGISYVLPLGYNYLSSLITYISKDLNDPIRIGIYGFLDRGLSILGIGSFIRYPFWYTALGGSYQTLAGQAIVGDINIWNYTKDIISTYAGAGRFVTPYYVINMFLVPAIYMAFLSSMSDKQEKKHFVLPMILACMLSFVVGNPLPLELLMLFTCPFLLLGYLGITATVFGYMSYAEIYLGSSISSAFNSITAMPGSFPDLIINLRSVTYYDSLINILLVGLVAGIIMYIVANIYFKYLTFNLINTTKDEAIINASVEALGGYDNIKNVGSGFFRTNFALENNELISVEKLNELGVSRITETKTGVSIDFGSSSYIIADRVKSTLIDLGRL